jgi:peptidoglycan L-alanyl-D-glutamate endopeptidase CwlK
MPQFSPISRANLDSCHQDLITLFNYVVTMYDCTVDCGYRTRAKQHQFFTEGKSKVDYPTVHNSRPSFAVDVYPYVSGKANYGNTPEEENQCRDFAGFVLCASLVLFAQGLITHCLRRGVDWNGNFDVKDQSFKDVCHFELIPNPGESLHYSET